MKFSHVGESEDEKYERELKSDRIERADTIFEQRRKLFEACPKDYFSKMKRRKKVVNA